ncbi:MAG: lecithin retinol acyltransferase family protein [Planctomycetia bacterium]
MALGDRLEVEQRVVGTTVTYMHHGVDAGDGTVVHARPDDFRNPFGGGRVVRTSRAEFAAGRPVRVTVDPPACFPPAEIVARALAHVGREGYSPLVDNCEHFATWCATGRRASRQVDIVLSRIRAAAGRTFAAVSARAAIGAGERIVIRTALGTTVRMGLRTLVPAAVAAEAAALVAEWRAHQAGRSPMESRQVGEAAGMVTSAATCGLAGAAAGPAGILAGTLAGIALWAGGSVATAAATAAAERTLGRREAFPQRR